MTTFFKTYRPTRGDTAFLMVAGLAGVSLTWLLSLQIRPPSVGPPNMAWFQGYAAQVLELERSPPRPLYF